MKHTVICPGCGKELFSGHKKDVIKWLMKVDGIDYCLWSRGVVSLMCKDCIK